MKFCLQEKEQEDSFIDFILEGEGVIRSKNNIPNVIWEELDLWRELMVSVDKWLRSLRKKKKG
jgi:hypothetical protein